MTNPAVWSPEDDAILRQLWAETEDTVTAIARAVRRRQSSVRSRAELLGLPPRERRPDILEWNEAQLATLRDRFAAGDSFSQIAALIGGGCSRNAALGKAHRLGLTRGAILNRHPRPARKPKPPRPAKPVLRAARPQPAPKPAKPRLAIHGNGAVVEVAKAPPPLAMLKRRAFEPLQNAPPKPWIERRDGECTWPVGDGMSCCAPVHKRGWCWEHHCLGTVPTRARSEAEIKADAARRFKAQRRAA